MLTKPGNTGTGGNNDIWGQENRITNDNYKEFNCLHKLGQLPWFCRVDLYDLNFLCKKPCVSENCKKGKILIFKDEEDNDYSILTMGKVKTEVCSKLACHVKKENKPTCVSFQP
ncbi:hypothetical protein L2E82_33188 [Cichorium intybus]|uniref:Uncharacterized protein n=1 Tax=Cichorium intybus TaxID=13427 RepID=A0ACB9BJG4_CICIN|nr:hypothetical protein L2E82_33188 [Cichorium intybus]